MARVRFTKLSFRRVLPGHWCAWSNRVLAWALIPLLTLAGEAKAYRIRAAEGSGGGGVSTTEPSILWTRAEEDSPPNGVVGIYILSSGARGEMRASISKEQIARGSTVAGTTHRFNAYIQEDLRRGVSVPIGSICRLTVNVGAAGEAFVGVKGGGPIPPSPDRGNALVDLTVQLGVGGSALMQGYSKLGVNNVWETVTSEDEDADESSFVLDGGKIKSARLALTVGTSITPYWLAVYITGEVRAGDYDFAIARAVLNTHVNFMMEVSTNGGTSYFPIPWTPGHTNFLRTLPPQLEFSRSLGTNRISVIGLPLSRVQLQSAPSPVGPWTDFGSDFIVPNLDPFTITDPGTNAMRFYRTITR